MENLAQALRAKVEHATEKIVVELDGEQTRVRVLMARGQLGRSATITERRPAGADRVEVNLPQVKRISDVSDHIDILRRQSLFAGPGGASAL